MKRVLMGAMLAALVFPLAGCIIRDRDHYYHDRYYHDYYGDHYYYHRR
jgi:hypothetical protein